MYINSFVRLFKKNYNLFKYIAYFYVNSIIVKKENMTWPKYVTLMYVVSVPVFLFLCIV